MLCTLYIFNINSFFLYTSLFEIKQFTRHLKVSVNTACKSLSNVLKLRAFSRI